LKKVAIIQARIGSSRLPGKVLKPILNRPMLQLLIERVRQVDMLDEVVVATSEKKIDDDIAVLVESLPEVSVYRGSEDNVLQRYYLAACEFNAAVILRITADNPFFDIETATKMLEMFHSGRYDYLANNFERTFPYGIDLEVFSRAVLEKSYREASYPEQLEHVTPYMRDRTGCFRHGRLSYNEDLSAMRLTVDTDEDYRRAVALFERFGQNVTFREIAHAGLI